jgi:hypothetical protein
MVYLNSTVIAEQVAEAIADCYYRILISLLYEDEHEVNFGVLLLINNRKSDYY